MVGRGGVASSSSSSSSSRLVVAAAAVESRFMLICSWFEGSREDFLRACCSGFTYDVATVRPSSGLLDALTLGLSLNPNALNP